MLQLSFNFDSQIPDRSLAAFQASLADFTPALQRVADDFREMVAEQFASEGRAGGTPWADLAPSTLRRKRRPGSGILYGTGALLASLRDPGAPDHVEERTGDSIVLGSRLPYALFHQTGTGWGFGRTQSAAGFRLGRGMPMRPILVVTGERSDAWVEMFRQALEEKVPLLGRKELG